MRDYFQDDSSASNGRKWEIELVTSRRALINVITNLQEHSQALTVIGGHAVIEITKRLPAAPPDDTTRDGDLGVNPQLLGANPQLEEQMKKLGYETARPERPGVWSPVDQRDRDPHLRDSVDLIAPMSLAREGLSSNRSIRAARVGSHGKHSVSATEGVELAVLDREWLTLRSFDGGPGVETYIAGAAALLCAKAYKLHDRLDPSELRRNTERLRPKDFADLYRLILVISPEKAAAVFQQRVEDDRISKAVQTGAGYLIEVLNSSETVAKNVADTWQLIDREDEYRQTIERWREDFCNEAKARGFYTV